MVQKNHSPGTLRKAALFYRQKCQIYMFQKRDDKIFTCNTLLIFEIAVKESIEWGRAFMRG